MFCEKNGKLHFIFAGKDDYFLNSLVRLDRSSYLYYKLKQDRYQGIYMINRTAGGRYKVVMRDRASVQMYPNELQGGLFGLGTIRIPLATENRDGHTFYEYRNLEMEALITQIMKLIENVTSPAIFLFPLDVFCELYREPMLQQRMAEALRHNNKSILLVSSLKADESVPFLTDRDSAVTQALCPELRELLASKRNEALFDSMQYSLGDNFKVLNCLERNDIRNMLEYKILIEKKDWPVGITDLTDVIDLLYLYEHSEEFRRDVDLDFPEDNEHKLSGLERVLDSRRSWEKILNAVRTLRKVVPEQQSFIDFFRRQESIHLTEKWMPQMSKTMMRRQIDEIVIDDLAQDVSRTRLAKMSRNLHEVKTSLSQAWSHPVDTYERDRSLNEAMQLLWNLKGSHQKDADTLEKSLEAMHYCACSRDRLRDPQIYERKAALYLQVAKATYQLGVKNRDILEKQRMLAEDELTLEEKWKEYYALKSQMPDLEDKKEAFAAGALTNSGEYLIINARQQEIVKLTEGVENQKKMIALLSNQANEVRQAIDNLQLTVTQIGSGGMGDIAAAMKNLNNLYSKEAAEKARYTKEIAEANEENRYLQEESMRLYGVANEASMLNTRFEMMEAKHRQKETMENTMNEAALKYQNTESFQTQRNENQEELTTC